MDERRQPESVGELMDDEMEREMWAPVIRTTAEQIARCRAALDLAKAHDQERAG